MAGFFSYEELAVVAHLYKQMSDAAHAKLSETERSLLPSDAEWQRVYVANTADDWRGFKARLRAATLTYQTDHRVCLSFRTCLDNLKSPISARLDGVNDIPVLGRDLDRLVPPLNEANAYAASLDRLQAEVDSLRLENAGLAAKVEELQRQLDLERSSVRSTISLFSNVRILSDWKGVSISIGGGLIEAILGLLHLKEIRQGLGKALNSVASTGKNFFSRLGRWAESNAIEGIERGAREKTAGFVRLEEQLRLPIAEQSSDPDPLPEPEPPADFDIVAVYKLILDGKAPPASWRPHIRALRFDFDSWKNFGKGFPEALAPLAERAEALDNLAPLKGLTGLQVLSLSGTGVADVSPLKGLTGLRELELANTGVADVSPLKGLTGLQTLSLANTGVADVSPLKGLTGLQSLRLDNTGVADVSPLKGLTGLQTLVLEKTGVADLSPLSGLTGLQRLWLGNTRVADVSALKGLTGLRTLSLSGTGVVDVSPLKGLTGLRTLSLSGKGVVDVSPLEGLTGLQTLWLDNTGVTDVSALKGLTELRQLWIDDDVDVTPLAHLPHLTIHGGKRGAAKKPVRPRPTGRRRPPQT